MHALEKRLLCQDYLQLLVVNGKWSESAATSGAWIHSVDDRRTLAVRFDPPPHDVPRALLFMGRFPSG
jgi:hypothetical protein